MAARSGDAEIGEHALHVAHEAEGAAIVEFRAVGQIGVQRLRGQEPAVVEMHSLDVIFERLVVEHDLFKCGDFSASISISSRKAWFALFGAVCTKTMGRGFSWAA